MPKCVRISMLCTVFTLSNSNGFCSNIWNYFIIYLVLICHWLDGIVQFRDELSRKLKLTLLKFDLRISRKRYMKLRDKPKNVACFSICLPLLIKVLFGWLISDTATVQILNIYWNFLWEGVFAKFLFSMEFLCSDHAHPFHASICFGQCGFFFSVRDTFIFE